MCLKKNGLKGVVRTYPTDTLIRAKYVDIKTFGKINVFAVRNPTGKYGIVSETDSLLQPFIYDVIAPQDTRTEIWLQTYIGHKTGAVNRYGELEAEPKYYTIKRYKYCYYVVLEDGPKGFVYKAKEYWED